jgi:G3E family GTPase
VVAFASSDEKFIFHGVHEQFSWGPSQELWAPGEKRMSKMVFIGENFDQEALQKAF